MVSSVTGAYPETKVMICQGCEDSPFSCQGTRYGAFTLNIRLPCLSKDLFPYCLCQIQQGLYCPPVFLYILASL